MTVCRQLAKHNGQQNGFAPLYRAHGWAILPELIEGSRHVHKLRAHHYPYRGDSRDVDGYRRLRPVDDGTPLLRGHTHDRRHGANGHQFRVGVGTHDLSPVPFAAIDVWLTQLVEHVS